MNPPLDLVADIGGTHARFALWQDDHAIAAHTLRCREWPHLTAAISHYLQQVNAKPSRAALAVAAPVLQDEITMPNHPWHFSVKALRQHFDWSQLSVVNDFTALALAVPSLQPSEIVQFGGECPDALPKSATIGVIGPGTGLGVSGLISTPKGYTVIQGEGGHRSLAPVSDAEWAFAADQKATTEHLSLEDILSGAGLIRLYQYFAPRTQALPPDLPLDPPIILAHHETCPASRNAIDLFCSLLGNAAGDLALTLGAVGGVYLGGGLLPRIGIYHLQNSLLRSQFENKGRYRSYLQRIPLFLITAENPAFRGAATLLSQPDYGLSVYR